MSAETVDFVNELVRKFPQLKPALAEHLEENFYRMLPHLFMSDVAHWAEARQTEDRRTYAEIGAYVATAYVQGVEDVRNLLYVSFFEDLTLGGELQVELSRVFD